MRLRFRVALSRRMGSRGTGSSWFVFAKRNSVYWIERWNLSKINVHSYTAECTVLFRGYTNNISGNFFVVDMQTETKTLKVMNHRFDRMQLMQGTGLFFQNSYCLSRTYFRYALININFSPRVLNIFTVLIVINIALQRIYDLRPRYRAT
jgi:hypothetical protein